MGWFSAPGPTLLYYRLTGYRYLKFFAKIYGVSQPEQRIHDLAKTLGLERWLTTHNTLEAESLCDRIALLSAGRLVAVDTLGNLLREVEDRVKLVATIKKSHHRSQPS